MSNVNGQEDAAVPDNTQGAVMKRVEQVIDDLQRGRVTSDRQLDELGQGVTRGKAANGVRRSARSW